jgi:hypothetical protein
MLPEATKLSTVFRKRFGICGWRIFALASGIHPAPLKRVPREPGTQHRPTRKMFDTWLPSLCRFAADMALKQIEGTPGDVA